MSNLTYARKRCPVCKFDKTYSGPCCEDCQALGYPKSALDRLPKKDRTRRVLVQASVPDYIRKKIASIIADEGWTWNQLLEAMMTEFLDAYKKEKKI